MSIVRFDLYRNLRISLSMSTTSYSYTGAVDCQTTIDPIKLKGKTVIVTGGASGLGKFWSQTFAKHGAFVVVADINPPADEATDYNLHYIKCDVTNWSDQVAVFKFALKHSPRHGIDIVVPSAGIYGEDILYGLEDPEPQVPDLKIIQVNLIGVLYTTKLAAYYFNRQPRDEFDRCLIVISSVMGYLDTQGSTLYGVAKHGIRGLMSTLRRKGLLRVNLIAPWFIRTPMMGDLMIEAVGKQLQEQGVSFASLEDSAAAIMHIATDTSMNGKALGIVPREISPSGYIDFEKDDFKEGEMLDRLQKVASSLVYPQLTKPQIL